MTQKTRRATLVLTGMNSVEASYSLSAHFQILSLKTPRSLPDASTMLARVVRSAPLQSAAKRTVSSSAPAAKAFQVPVTPSAAAAVSSGELAWCEIYGIDYDQQVQEALDESPLLVTEAHRAVSHRPSGALTAAATTATSASATAKGDIWNVVFGASTA